MPPRATTTGVSKDQRFVVSQPGFALEAWRFCLQVCKHWNKVLATPEARNAIWHEAVVDFGHELITAVHTPIAWSDKRPSDEEFKKSFSQTKLDADRILRFLRERRNSLRKVVLMSSEGYWSGGPPPFLSLAQRLFQKSPCVVHAPQLFQMRLSKQAPYVEAEVGT